MQHKTLLSLAALFLLTLLVLALPLVWFRWSDSRTLSAVSLSPVQQQDTQNLIAAPADTAQILTMLKNDDLTASPLPAGQDGKALLKTCLTQVVNHCIVHSTAKTFSAFIEGDFLGLWDQYWQLEYADVLSGAAIIDQTICTATLYRVQIRNTINGQYAFFLFDANNTLYSFSLDGIDTGLSREERTVLTANLQLLSWDFLTQYLDLRFDPADYPELYSPEQFSQEIVPGESETDTSALEDTLIWDLFPALSAFNINQICWGPATIYWDGTFFAINLPYL